MVFTGYFKTEKSASKTPGWTSVDTSIDEALHMNFYNNNPAIGGYQQTYVDGLGVTLYMHNEDDGDTSYKVLSTSTWDDSDTAYSGTDTATPLYSAITELVGGVGTIFTSNQDFDDHAIDWIVTFNAKATDPPIGEVSFLEFKFYKVATDDTETLLFTAQEGVSTLYGFSPLTASIRASGSVTTDDRLLIKVFFGSAPPA